MSATPMTVETQPSALPGASLDARAQLTWRLADVLSLPEGRTTVNDRAMAGDMLATVLSASDAGVRTEIATRLAVATGLPCVLVRQLALDLPAIAAAVLVRMTEVPDAVLAEAAGVSPDHRRMIAGRDTLSSVVAEALLASDDGDLGATILRSETIALTPARVDTLVRRSLNDETLRRPLLSRPELRPAQGFMMFWWCGTSDRRRVLARFSMDRTILQDTLQPLFATVFTDDDADPLIKRMLRLIDRRHRPRGENGEVVTPEVLERTLTAARATPTPEFCHAVGLLAGVGTETATRVMHDPGGEPFAILAKSAGLSRGAFATLMETAAAMPQGKGPSFAKSRQDALLATFDTAARDYARAVLQYWDWRPDPGPGFSQPPVHTAPSSLAAHDDAEGYLGAV